MNQLILARLDPPTFMFCMSLFGFMMAAISCSTGSVLGCKISGLLEWSRAMLATGMAFFLLYLRGSMPEFLTVFTANMLIMAVVYYSVMAHVKFFCIPSPKKSLSVLIAAGVGGTSYSYWSTVDRSGLVLSMSLPVGCLLLMLVRMVARNSPWRKQRFTWASLVIMLVMSAELFYRSWYVLSGNTIVIASLTRPDAQFGFLITGAVCIMGTSIGFILMVLEKHRQKILENSKRDGLTGLYHRSAFFECVDVIEAADEDSLCSIVMIDIDHFKSINDTYGHTCGDVAIMHIARLISNCVRNSDVAGRYGGEEFCVFLRGCGREEAAKFAKRLVNEASSQRIRLGEGREVGLTISAGYASRGGAGTESRSVTIECLLESADQALLLAKRAGRNRAVGA